MDYYFNVTDKTMTVSYRNNHKKSLTHKENENFIRKKHTIHNPRLSETNEGLNDYITNHNKKFELYLFKANIKLDFDSFAHHVKTNFF